MNVLQINTVYAQGSTGNIAKMLHDLCLDHQLTCVTGCRCIPKGQDALEDVIAVSSTWDSRVHGWWSWFTMFKGMGSYRKTAAFLKRLKNDMPDLIHLHNLHGSYIHLPLLFRFIKEHNIPVVWTLHDCWAFTAICSHYTIAQCDRWQTGCHDCPQRKRFSAAPVDSSKRVWSLKRSWFQQVPNMTIVTPSAWLSAQVKASFLKEYPVMTIHNGIDLQVFSPTDSDFRQRYHLEDKRIVLGVAFGWGKEKGLDVFLSLAQRLDDHYRLVLVGTTEAMDATLPDKVISIHRTHDQTELAAIYSQADVFVNPTREDTFPTVNLEALACGTPVVTFQTGGSPECIDPSCGVVVEVDDLATMEQEIVRICTTQPYDEAACRKRAEQFEKTQRLEEYIALYKRLLNSNRS